jgi:hypothetical protein
MNMSAVVYWLAPQRGWCYNNAIHRKETGAVIERTNQEWLAALRGRGRDEALADLGALLVRGIITTRPDEIGCDECFEQLDRFVEMTLAGKNAAEAMPLVQDHLERCRDCREEFEALLAALRALQ